MGIATNGLWQAFDFTGRYPSKVGEHDLKDRSVSELARDHYLPDEQRKALHSIFRFGTC